MFGGVANGRKDVCLVRLLRRHWEGHGRMRWCCLCGPLMVEVPHALAKFTEGNVVGDHEGHDDHHDDKLYVVSIESHSNERILEGGRGLTIDFQVRCVVKSLIMSAR